MVVGHLRSPETMVSVDEECSLVARPALSEMMRDSSHDNPGDSRHEFGVLIAAGCAAQRLVLRPRNPQNE
jgi:hypothetical protein